MLGQHPGERGGGDRAATPRFTTLGFPSVAVVQPKGGVGKTTIAVNLACGLAHAGMRTLLVDTDPLGSASRYLGLGAGFDDGHTVADVMSGRAGVTPPGSATGSPSEIEAAVDRIFAEPERPTAAHAVPEVPGLFVVPSSRSLSRMERRLADPMRLRNALAEVPHHRLDAVVVDTPPRWDLLTINALTAVRAVVAPTELKPLSLMALARLTEGIDKIRRRTNPQLEPVPWIVPSRVRHTRMTDRCMIDLAESFPGRLLPSIRESTRVAEAPGFHMPVWRYAPRSIGADDFEALTDAALERILGLLSPSWVAPC